MFFMEANDTPRNPRVQMTAAPARHPVGAEFHPSAPPPKKKGQLRVNTLIFARNVKHIGFNIRLRVCINIQLKTCNW